MKLRVESPRSGDMTFRAAVVIVACGCASPTAPQSNIEPAHPAERRPSGPYAPQPLQGPFRSIAEWCAKLPAATEEDPRSGCLSAYAPIVSSGPARIRGAELVPFADRNIMGPSCAIAIHRGAAIWIDDTLELPCLPPPGEHSIMLSVDLKSFAWNDLIRNVPGEAIGPELVVAFAVLRHTATDEVDVFGQDEIVCGTGASEHPACTPPIPISRRGLSAIAFDPAIASDGMLSFHVEDPEQGLDSPDEYRQTYPLVFP
jgi:hypothetical protein